MLESQRGLKKLEIHMMQHLVSRGLLKENLIIKQKYTNKMLPVNFTKSCLKFGFPMSLLFFFLFP